MPTAKTQSLHSTSLCTYIMYPRLLLRSSGFIIMQHWKLDPGSWSNWWNKSPLGMGFAWRVSYIWDWKSWNPSYATYSFSIILGNMKLSLTIATGLSETGTRRKCGISRRYPLIHYLASVTNMLSHTYHALLTTQSRPCQSLLYWASTMVHCVTRPWLGSLDRSGITGFP